MDIERRRKYFKGIVSESAITREFTDHEEPRLEVCEEKSVLSNIDLEAMKNCEQLHRLRLAK